MKAKQEQQTKIFPYDDSDFCTEEGDILHVGKDLYVVSKGACVDCDIYKERNKANMGWLRCMAFVAYQSDEAKRRTLNLNTTVTKSCMLVGKCYKKAGRIL